MKKIVIIGGGFGGLACAKSLLKRNKDFEITLIDKNPYHNIHGNLYEVATIPAELVDLRELKRSVNIPFAQIFKNQKINLVVGGVTAIDPERKKVLVGSSEYSYDYLVIAQGARANYYDTPGADQHALPLQTSYDALLIGSRVTQAIMELKTNLRKKSVDLVVVGGGVAGVEIAAEMRGMINFLCWENSISSEKVKLHIVERAPDVLAMMPHAVIYAAKKRLRELDVQIHTNKAITKITAHQIKTEDHKVMSYDVLIWTAGVKPEQLKFADRDMPLTLHGRCQVNGCFKAFENSTVFVVGDQSCFMDQYGNPLPGTAHQAIDEGHYVAKAIINFEKGQTPKPYHCKPAPMVITLGQRWAIFVNQRWMATGLIAYWIRELIWFRYFVSILGFGEGLHWLLRTENIYRRNDVN
ncbi:MAG: FAD-dependent oxidoreductase [Candidatus Doudnabacteria bacterium]